MSRRTVLKTLGIASVPATSATIATADANQEKYEKIRQQALHLREKTGNSQLFRQYLRKHGFNVVYMAKTEPLIHSDDVSTQDAQGNITTTLTNYSAPCTGDFYSDLEWKYDTSGELWNNEADINTISFDYDHFDVVGHSGGDSYCTFMEQKGTGVAYKWDSAAAFNNDTYSSYIEASLEPRGSYSESERIIFGNIHHFHTDWGGGYNITWHGDGSVQVQGISSGGVEYDPNWISHVEKPQSDAYYPC